MSLYVDDRRGGRDRSRSRSRDRRPRDEPEQETRPAPTYADVREPSYAYPEDDLDGVYKPSRSRRDDGAAAAGGGGGGGLPYPSEGGMDSMYPGDAALYSYDGYSKKASPPVEKEYRGSKESVPGAFPEEDRRRKDRDEDRYRRDEDPRRTRDVDPEDRRSSRYKRDDQDSPRERNGRGDVDEDKLKHLPMKYSRTYGDAAPESPRSEKPKRASLADPLSFLPAKYSQRGGKDNDEQGSDREKSRRSKREVDDEDDLAYGKPYSPREAPDRYGSFAPDEDKRGSRYGREESPSRKKQSSPPEGYGSRYGRDSYQRDPRDSRDPRESYSGDPRDSRSDVLTFEPPSSRRSKSPRPDAEDSRGSRDHRNSRDPRDSYSGDPRDSRSDVLTVEPPSSRRSKSPGPAADPRDSQRDVLTVEPTGSSRRSRSPGPSALTVEPKERERGSSRDRRRDKSPGPSALTIDAEPRHRDSSRDRRSAMRAPSPQPPTARMSSLTVDTGRSSTASLSLANAPGSPLLESYHGTYQACSPMPSPLLLTSSGPQTDIEPLSPLDDKPRSRRARFHDPEDIASQLARALKGDGPPDTYPLIDILPSLTHDQVMELRTEYKRLVKTGSARKGVNIAKHIRARLKDEDPSLMKACYSVALGRWEAEAYWANFWYQGDKTRRELLIESLMGRTNAEIAQIKMAFSDKKYDNSLTKCMKTELKEDKFKKAVLMVLEERRMEDRDSSGRVVPLDYKLVDRDADELYKSVRAEKGGESAMIAIVVQRSDTHLRAVLKEYERAYRGNFAKDALKKSGNLVGELLAHILNGIINRPVRDALLLHHALTASRKDDLRRELLISRLVRFHWDAAHMSAIRKAYRERYGRELQDAVKEATSGQWGMFCREMCIARAPDDVRRFEKVEYIDR